MKKILLLMFLSVFLLSVISALTVTLNSPSNATGIFSNTDTSFSSSLSSPTFPLSNATIYVWNYTSVSNLQNNMWVSSKASNFATRVYSNGTMVNYTTGGNQLHNIAYCNGSMWIADYGASTVYQVYSNGTSILYSPAGLSGSHGIACDNNNMVWVSDQNTNSVTEIYTYNGTAVATYSGTVNTPATIAFDGQNMWAIGASTPYGVSKIWTNNGTIVNFYGTGLGAIDLVYDQNGSIWTTNFLSNSVTKVNITTGAMVNYSNRYGNAGANDIASDGTYLWVGNYNNNSVSVFWENGTVKAVYNGTGVNPQTIAYDGNGSMWTANYGDGSVTKINMSTGAMVNYTGAGSQPYGIAAENTINGNLTQFPSQNVHPLVTSITNTTFDITNSSTFTINLPAGTYAWNVLGVQGNGNGSNSTFATSNFTFYTSGFTDLNNYTYSSPVSESSTNTFSGEFLTLNPIVTSYFQYNNTNYSTSITSLGSNLYILSATVTAPEVNLNTNISWFFWINGLNTTSKNQTVTLVSIDNCGSFTHLLVNYTLADEETQSLINDSNSTIQSLIILKSITGTPTIQFNQNFNGTSNGSICSQVDLSNSGLYLWEQSRYGSTGYAYQSHDYQNLSVTSTPINITLLDLPSALATKFRITYKSITYLPVPNAVVDIQRDYFGEGVYKSVESPLTDSNGQANGNFNLNAVTYRIVVSQNGTILGTFQNPAIACSNILTGDCSIDLTQGQSVNLIQNYDVANDFSYGLSQNNRTISLVFNVPSGIAKTVNLFINESTILQNTTACNNTVYASNGELDCYINDTLGDAQTSVFVFVNGNLVTTASSQVLTDRSQYFGTDNVIMSFFLILSLVLLMVSDPIALLFGLIIGIIASGLLLLLNSGSLFGGLSVLLWLIIVVIILIVKISQRRY